MGSTPEIGTFDLPVIRKAQLPPSRNSPYVHPDTFEGDQIAVHAIKSAVLIVNPNSGGSAKKAKKEKAVQLLQTEAAAEQISITRVETQHARHCIEIVREYLLDQVDAIIIVGGDGTVREAVQGLLDRKDGRKVPILVAPYGSGNNYARDLGIKNIKDSIQALKGGKVKDVDAFQVDHRDGSTISINIVSSGMTVDCTEFAERSLRVFGPLKYDIAVFWFIMKNKKYPGTIHPERGELGKSLTGDYPIVILQNTRACGNNFQLTPSSALDDGLMDVVIHRNLHSRWGLLQLFLQMKDKCKHVLHPSVEYMQVDKLTLSTSDKSVNIDGDVVVYSPVTVKPLKHSWQTIVP